MYYELKAQLNYQLCYPILTEWPDEDAEVNIRVKPVLQGYNPNMDDDCVVLDIDLLMDAYQKLENLNDYYLTCECDYAEDVGILAPLDITITQNEVYWDLDIASYRAILMPPYVHERQGTLRLIFDKHQYQESIHRLLKQLQSIVINGIDVDQLKNAQCYPRLLSNHVHLKTLFVDSIYPNCNIDRLKSLEL